MKIATDRNRENCRAGQLKTLYLSEVFRNKFKRRRYSCFWTLLSNLPFDP